MTGFEVGYDALARGAREHHGLADEASRARRSLDGAVLPPGALGKLPQSDEIRRTADEQWHAMADALDGLVRGFTQIQDGLLATVEAYRASDQAVADALSPQARR